ncbi:MAG: ABC transporter permease [Clostridia bacterium]|nr:ABC transporter permease [Clostridia bacterium]
MANKSATAEKKQREPLFHIVKRDGLRPWEPYAIRAVAILLALIVSSLLTLILTGKNPFLLFSAMFEGSFGSFRRFLSMLSDLAILLCISLAVTPAFKMRFWNIGAEGQVLAGGLATAACMILMKGWPIAVMIPLMLIVAVVAGALWAILPAVCKAFWGTNETLFTLMMNYVAIQLVRYFVTVWENPKGSGHIGVIRNGQLPAIAGYSEIIPILVVATAVALMYVYLKYSKHGYEIEVVGQSENTARYIGINVKHVIIRTMLVSGAICGLAGFLLVSGTDHTISPDTAGGDGFTAIMVSWLAKFNPLYMALTAFLIVFLSRGGGEIATTMRLNSSFPEILTGIILFFIIGCEFFIHYSVRLRHKKAAPAEVAADADSEEKEDRE